MSVEAAPHNTGVAEGGLPAYRFDSIERAHGGRVLLDGNWRYVLGADLRRIDLFFQTRRSGESIWYVNGGLTRDAD